MKNLVECFGEDIEDKGLKAKMYLSYRINKEDLHYIDYELNEYTHTEKFDYVIMIYNQLTEQISLEFKVYEFGELVDRDIIETLWTRDEFFRIISLIE